MLKIKKIKVEVYGMYVYVLIGNKEEASKYIRKYFIKNSNSKDSEGTISENADGCTFYSGGHSLVWIPSIPKTAYSISVLGHELLHATFNMLDYVGAEYRYNGSNEPYTYLLGFLLEQALNTKSYREVKTKHK